MLKKLAIYSLTVAMFGAGSAVAHTGVKDQGIEGKTLYTAFTIGHGCASTANTVPLPVIAQSVLFPNATTSVAVKVNPTTGKDEEGTINLSEFIKDANGGVVTLGPKAVQDKSVFQVSRSTVDTNGNVRGIKLVRGKLDPTMVGAIPFKVSGIKFVPGSCANSLQVRVAIANWCKKSQDVNDDRRVDMWMANSTTKFNDLDVMDLAYWPTLTINRDLVANPLPAACGAGHPVAVQPAAADIDALLPIKGYWPKP